MNLRQLVMYVCASCLFISCVNQRSTTHWIIHNDTPSDLALTLSVQSQTGGTHFTRQRTVKPGIHEIESRSFRKGRYLITANASHPAVANTRMAYFDSETWVLIGFANGDSTSLARRFGYLDTSILQPTTHGHFAGFTINSEQRLPPMMYSLTLGKN